MSNAIKNPTPWYPNLESEAGSPDLIFRKKAAEGMRIAFDGLYSIRDALQAINAQELVKKTDLPGLLSSKPIAEIVSQSLNVSGVAPLDLQGLAGALHSPVVVDVWANLPAANSQPIGMLFWATDRTVLYLVESVSGASSWVYIAGTARTTLANILTGLGTNDAGLLNFITDYSHTLRWDGAAWTWAPGDDGSGYYRLCESVPTGFGASAWQTCDGSTVARLNADGTTTNVTVPDVTTAAYLKAGLAAAAIAGASGVTGAPSATTTVDNTLAGSTVAVGSATHTHTPSTLEFRNKQTALYFRR